MKCDEPNDACIAYLVLNVAWYLVTLRWQGRMGIKLMFNWNSYIDIWRERKWNEQDKKKMRKKRKEPGDIL